jgi:histone deacetylase complex regulatory component SIN3
LNIKLSHDPASTTLTTNGQGLSKLAAACEEEGTRLLAAIVNLKLEQTDSKWRSFQQALKCVWRERNIRELEKRLDGYRSELKIQLLKLLSDQQSNFLTVLRSLVDENRRMKIDRNQQVQNLV